MTPPATVEPIAAGGLRLNLGGRDTNIPGFKTVDLHEGPTVDIIADISQLPMIENGTVEEIYASHCLEHFPHPKTVSVLKEWRRVLKKGGKCFVAVPDFDAAVKLYLKEGLSEFIRNLLWGDQGYDLAYHYAGFTFPFLAKLLVDAGFDDVIRRKWMPYQLNDCSRLVDTVSFQPISLNVEATA